jgi:hypothetical protein
MGQRASSRSNADRVVVTSPKPVRLRRPIYEERWTSRPVRLSTWPLPFAIVAFARRRAAFSRARDPFRRDT